MKQGTLHWGVAITGILMATVLTVSFWPSAQGGETPVSQGDSVGVLLQNGWDLTADTLADPGVFPPADTAIAASFTSGNWTVGYKAFTADEWHDMEYVTQWDQMTCSPFYNGQTIAYYSGVSENINYRVHVENDALYSWFKLQTYDGDKGDPWGCLLYTAPADGTYKAAGNADCPKIGIPLVDWLDAAGVNFGADYWVEVNGVEVAGTRYSFDKNTLDMDFPAMTLELKQGDAVRFIVSMGQSWAGWKQRFMMAPVMTLEEKPTTTTEKPTTTTEEPTATTTEAQVVSVMETNAPPPTSRTDAASSPGTGERQTPVLLIAGAALMVLGGLVIRRQGKQVKKR